MLTPCRDDVNLSAPLHLPDLPVDVPWEGRIAYLDRDGVIIEGSENYVNSVDEVVLLHDSAKCVGDLRRAGYRICIVTNQSPINRGIWTSSNLSMIHDRMRQLLLQEDSDAHLDLVLHSPYAPWEGAWARKPFPGMLEAGRQLLDAASSNPSMDGQTIQFGDEWTSRPDESASVMVGDRGVDMSAAVRFGVRGVLCDSDRGISEVIGEILGGSD